MRPDDNKQLSVPQRGTVQAPPRTHEAAHQAVANMTRQQIEAIYSGQQQPQIQTTPKPDPQLAPAVQADSNSYARTHQAAHTASANQWRQYHSAWQDYYQKYYEQYYVGAVAQVHQAYSDQASKLHPEPNGHFAQTPEKSDESFSKEEAMYDLRNQIVNKVQESSKKVRKSRHFVPMLSALTVLMLFLVLQFNSVIIANVKAYVTPGEIDPQNIIVDPSASTVVGPKPLLVIPKINVSVPIVFDTTPDQKSQLKAMENGVAYFGIPGADSKPGQVGNTVISGHSSNDFIETGNYKFVFALLERMKKGDVFYVHYKGTRYTYTVTKTQVVKPTDVSALVYPTTKPEVTLITCTPLGTALNRLLVIGEQVSPDPTKAKAAPTNDSSTKSTSTIPGTSPTFLERIFGSGN